MFLPDPLQENDKYYLLRIVSLPNNREMPLWVMFWYYYRKASLDREPETIYLRHSSRNIGSRELGRPLKQWK